MSRLRASRLSGASGVKLKLVRWYFYLEELKWNDITSLDETFYVEEQQPSTLDINWILGITCTESFTMLSTYQRHLLLTVYLQGVHGARKKFGLGTRSYYSEMKKILACLTSRENQIDIPRLW